MSTHNVCFLGEILREKNLITNYSSYLAYWSFIIKEKDLFIEISCFLSLGINS